MKLKSDKFYKALAPRITVLVTTIDAKGRINAAPFSFAMPVSMDPPMLVLGLNPKNDTIANIKETKEFVVNIPSKDILTQVWDCSEDFPRGVNELEKTGLTEAKSNKVKPPRVKECLAWFECTLEWIKEAGDHIIVVGKVLEAEVKDEYIKKDGNLDAEKAEVLMHVGGKEFTVPKNI
ncbi:MAG: flavin reductase family protein [Candidatus Altiarchaeota archaeon]